MNRTAVPSVLLATFLAACNTTERDWEAAKKANTSSGYSTFVSQHPQGPHVDEAKAGIENVEWSDAHTSNTLPAYTRFLAKHPNEAHSRDARAARLALQSVAGKTYVTPERDIIFFAKNGRALERNGNPTIAYAGQMIAFDNAGQLAGTPCDYKQDGDKISLTCGEGAKADYEIAADGSLQGPSEGMFKHPAFAHLTEQK